MYFDFTVDPMFWVGMGVVLALAIVYITVAWIIPPKAQIDDKKSKS